MEKHVLMLCLLGNPYQKVEGGYHRTIYELMEYFKNKDITITLITSNSLLPEDRFQQIYSNINFWELALTPTWVNNQDNLYINADYLLEKIDAIIHSYRDSISLIHSFQWINGYLALRINPQHKIRHIHSIISSSYERELRGFRLRSQYQKYCEDCTFKNADILISITEAEKKQLVDQYHIPSSKILIVGRSVDFYYSYFHDIRHNLISKKDKLDFNTTLAKKGELKKQKAFIYIGRIIEYKGIQEIIKAWEHLYEQYKEEMPPLWIIGGKETDIEQFHQLLSQEIPSLTQYEQKHKIYWWGYMESYGISTILQKCHVLLMHSAFEPGGRVVLESMASSKPVIATFTGFAQTYIINWYNGFLVKYQDIKQLAHFMNFFIINGYLSNMMGINAQKTYNILKNNWRYFECFDKLYHSMKVDIETTSFETILLKDRKRQIILRSDTKLPQPFASWSNSL